MYQFRFGDPFIRAWYMVSTTARAAFSTQMSIWKLCEKTMRMTNDVDLLSRIFIHGTIITITITMYFLCLFYPFLGIKRNIFGTL